MGEVQRRFAVVLIGAAVLVLVAALARPVGMPLGASGTPGATPEVACPSPVASPGASPVALEGSGMVASTHEVTIKLTDEGFVPNYVQTTTGHDIRITLINTGTRDHGFKIDRYDIDELLAPGESTLVILRNPEEITVEYYSDAPCDPGMTGELTLYI